MVGPEVEKTALVRHCSRLFVTGANLSVPFGTIVLRKAYGLGAQAMAGGSFHAPTFALAWPTGEFGGMGLEGAVKLGYRKELEAIADPAERRALFDKMVAAAYARGKALSTATYFEVDEVIDPADSRRWIATALLGANRGRATSTRSGRTSIRGEENFRGVGVAAPGAVGGGARPRRARGGGSHPPCVPPPPGREETNKDRGQAVYPHRRAPHPPPRCRPRRAPSRRGRAQHETTDPSPVTTPGSAAAAA